MKDVVWIIIWAAIIVAVFVWLWRAKHLERFAAYIQQTREELRKCTWPTWDELKGSTLVVTISIVLLGGFTVAIDNILFKVFLFFKL